MTYESRWWLGTLIIKLARLGLPDQVIRRCVFDDEQQMSSPFVIHIHVVVISRPRKLHVKYFTVDFIV